MTKPKISISYKVYSGTDANFGTKGIANPEYCYNYIDNYVNMENRLSIDELYKYLKDFDKFNRNFLWEIRKPK